MGVYLPKKEPLKLRLKDLLEPSVDEKYFLREKMMQYIVADDFDLKKVNLLGGIGKKDSNSNTQWKYQNRIYSSDNSMPSIATAFNPYVAIGNKHLKETLEQNKIKDGLFIDGYNRKTSEIAGAIDNGVNFRNDKYICVKNATQKGYLEAQEGDGVDISSRMATHRGTVQKDMAQTINTQQDGGVVVLQEKLQDLVDITKEELRIRKLTPKECWRLMGFDDEAFNKANQVNSNAQLYKQAGNSIVVNVLEKILTNLLITEVKDIQLNIFDLMDQEAEMIP